MESVATDGTTGLDLPLSKNRLSTLSFSSSPSIEPARTALLADLANFISLMSPTSKKSPPHLSKL
jgi:hypothetical protein